MDTTKTLYATITDAHISAVNDAIYVAMFDATVNFDIHNGRDTVFIKQVPEVTLTTGKGFPLDEFIVLSNLNDSSKSRQGLWIPLTHADFTGVIIKIVYSEASRAPTGFWATYLTNDNTLCSFSKICDIRPFLEDPISDLINYLMINSAGRYIKEIIQGSPHTDGKLYGIGTETSTGLWEIETVKDDVQPSTDYHINRNILELKHLAESLMDRDKVIEELRAQLHSEHDEYLEVRHAVALHVQNVELLENQINKLRNINQQLHVDYEKCKNVVSAQRGKLKQLQGNEDVGTVLENILTKQDEPISTKVVGSWVRGHNTVVGVKSNSVNKEITRLTIKLAGLSFDERFTEEEIAKRQKKLIKKLNELRRDI
jgi:hypothetical protein